MFFADKVAGLREMLRVLKPRRRLAIAVWDRLEECPGYAGLVQLLENVCGREIADGLRVPFSLGDGRRLHVLCAEAGLGNVTLSTHPGEACFRSIRSWIFTNVNGWTFAPQIDTEQFVTLMQQAERALAAFTRADGSVAHRVSAHIIVAQKN
jgi:hypothetical protein